MINKEILPIKKNHFKIFLFHGVIKKNNCKIRNYTKKHLLENKFLKYIKFLKKNSYLMSLENITYYLKNNFNLPSNTCAITFDDGFENNYSIAAPILDDFKIPTTFYFSSDFVENNSMSWIDKIEFCFENTRKATITLPWRKKNVDFNNNQQKILILNEIRKKVKKNFKIKINDFVQSIFYQCNLEDPKRLDNTLDKKIKWKQVIELKNNSLFKIGGHSHNHLSLGSLSKKDVDFQINKSFNLFKKRAKIRLTNYSYPEGTKIDYNEYIIHILKTKGIKICPTAIAGLNNMNTDLFNLKRIML